MGYPFKVNSGEENNVTAGSLWRGFEGTTTVHGVPHVATAVGKSKTFVWFLISLTALGMLSYHMYTICSMYFSYGVNVKITILEEYAMDFPAVTFCNLNPIKKSNIGLDSVIQSLLGDGAKSNNTAKKRKKRYTNTSPTCASTDRLQDELGLCYRLITTELRKLTGNGHAVQRCNDIGGAVYFPCSQSRVNFMKATDLFTIAGVNTYWNWILNDAWAGQLSAVFTYWGNKVNSLDSAVSVVNNDHRWDSQPQDHSSNMHYILCQDMVQCPHPVYDPDGDGLGFCWMRPFGDAVNSWAKSEAVCSEYDPDAYLMQLDSLEKMNHFINKSGILDGTLENSYWLNINGGRWKKDNKVVTWENLAPNPTVYGYSSGDAVLVYIDQNHKWFYAADNNAAVSSGMVICEIANLPYVSPNVLTTIASTLEPTTVEMTTTIKTTTTIETTTTPEPTTVEITTPIKPTTTHKPNTVEMTTTIQPTTIEVMSTLEPMTTSESSTNFESFVPTTSIIASTEGETTTVMQSTMTPNKETTTTTYQQPTTSPITLSQSPAATIVPATLPVSSIEGKLPLTEEYILQETVIENLAVIPDRVKTLMSYSAYEFIIDCTYEGSTCSREDFYQYYSPIMGNCYIFNSGWNNTAPLHNSKKTGRRYGLRVTLNIGEDEYVEKLGGSSGARVVTTGQNEMPHPEQDGIFVEPGKVVSIGVRKVAIERMGQVYGNCTDQLNNPEDDVFSELYPVKYSTNNCKRTCYQKKLIDRCGCADSYYPRSGTAFGRKSVQPCDVTNMTQDDCKYRVNNEFVKGNLGCSEICHDVCSEHYFTHDLSIAKWPSEAHKSKVVEKLQPNIQGYNLSEGSVIERNLLMVEVFYDDFSYEEIREMPAYPSGQFASDIGGILGLWIGMSVITVFEFIELFIDLILLFIMKICPKQDKDISKYPETVKISPSIIQVKSSHQEMSCHSIRRSSLNREKSHSKPKSLTLMRTKSRNNSTKSRSMRIHKRNHTKDHVGRKSSLYSVTDTSVSSNGSVFSMDVQSKRSVSAVRVVESTSDDVFSNNIPSNIQHPPHWWLVLKGKAFDVNSTTRRGSMSRDTLASVEW